LTDRFHGVEIAASLAGMTAIVVEIVSEFIDSIDTVSNLFDVYMFALSIKIICSSWMFLRFASVYEPLGVLVIMIQKMAADLTVFLMLFAAVTLGFTLAIYAHEKAGFIETGEENIFSATGSVWITLWALYGEFDPGIMMDSLSAVFVWVYVLLSSVVLVNLLVAMFSDTFSRVKEGAEEEYMLFKCERLYYLIYVMHPLPPPFNLPIALYSLTKRAIRSAKQLYSAYSARGSMIPGRGLREAERRSLLDSIHLRNKSEASSERANDGRQLVRKYTMQQEREKTESSLEVANALKSKLDELMRMHTVLASEIAENGTSRSRAVDRLRNTVGHEQSAHLEQGGADDRGGKARAPPTIDETSPKHDFFALSFFKIPAHTTKDTISAAVKTTSSIASKSASFEFMYVVNGLHGKRATCTR